MAPDAPLAVTILTGFLGAGKTTILNQYLRAKGGTGTAVLVNEFGEIDIDGAVLSASLGDGSQVMTLPNGCVCCAVQEEFAEALLGILGRRKNQGGLINRCIIEITGLADPGAIIRGLGHDPRLREGASVDQTVTVCAADRVLDELPRFEEVARQIGIADRIVVSKTDLVSSKTHRAVLDSARRINPLASLCDADIEANERYACLDKPTKITALTASELKQQPPLHSDKHSHSSVHTFHLAVTHPLDPDRFRDVMSFLIMRHAENLLRIKGNVHFAPDNGRRLINCVHDVFTSELIDDGPDTHAADGAIVFIGIDLPEVQIRADIRACEVQKIRQQ